MSKPTHKAKASAKPKEPLFPTAPIDNIKLTRDKFLKKVQYIALIQNYYVHLKNKKWGQHYKRCINKMRTTKKGQIAKSHTQDLIGHQVTINKSDYSQVKGKEVKVSEQNIMLGLSKGITGVESNVWLTIIDRNGIDI